MWILGKCGVGILSAEGLSVLRAHTAASLGCVSGRIILLNIKYITDTAHLSPLGSSKTICLLTFINPNHCYPLVTLQRPSKMFFFFPLLVSFCIGHSSIKKLFYCITNTFNHLSPDRFDGGTEMFLI